jgi:hypothetical protein
MADLRNPSVVADSRTCIVEFHARGAKWANVTAASSTFEAARIAYRFLHDPHWRGPRPTPETIFEISLVGDERKWRVKVGMALKSCAGEKISQSA